MLNNKIAIKDWLLKNKIFSFTINDDLSVDVKGSVNLYMLKVDELPIQFGVISGDFNISCCQFKNLKGSPKHVFGSFNCSENPIESLEFVTQKIGGNFDCSFCRLKELTIKGNFNCSNNLLKSLVGAPLKINGKLNCKNNKLTKLSFFPSDVSEIMLTRDKINKKLFEMLLNKKPQEMKLIEAKFNMTKKINNLFDFEETNVKISRSKL
jgi:hypothetical protein